MTFASPSSSTVPSSAAPIASSANRVVSMFCHAARSSGARSAGACASANAWNLRLAAASGGVHPGEDAEGTSAEETETSSVSRTLNPKPSARSASANSAAATTSATTSHADATRRFTSSSAAAAAASPSLAASAARPRAATTSRPSTPTRRPSASRSSTRRCALRGSAARHARTTSIGSFVAARRAGAISTPKDGRRRIVATASRVALNASEDENEDDEAELAELEGGAHSRRMDSARATAGSSAVVAE